MMLETVYIYNDTLSRKTQYFNDMLFMIVGTTFDKTILIPIVSMHALV